MSILLHIFETCTAGPIPTSLRVNTITLVQTEKSGKASMRVPPTAVITSAARSGLVSLGLCSPRNSGAAHFSHHSAADGDHETGGGALRRRTWDDGHFNLCVWLRDFLEGTAGPQKTQARPAGPSWRWQNETTLQLGRMTYLISKLAFRFQHVWYVDLCHESF